MRTALVFVLFGLLATVMAFTELQHKVLFRKFVGEHHKIYHRDEFSQRFETFKANVERIAQHNAEPTHSFKLGINQFADMTQEEFRVKHLGYTMSKKLSSTVSEVPSAVALPDAVDWRAKKAVGPVKNQGQCGGCWSFSTTGAIEGAWAIATGRLLSLSQQQLIDCSSAQGNKGCNGGAMDQAFNYVIKNKGICAEVAYPFVAKQGTCRKCTSVARLSGFKDVTPNSEDALQAAAAQQPVSIAIEADSHVFQFYSTGVFDSADCGTNLNHAVLLAGYGSVGGKDFWLVKNSWGPTWGMAGYIQIVRNVGPSGSARQCGITMAPSYPIAASATGKL